jgi:hypothetical protein
MATPWYSKFLELIGFDILLVGALFILVVLIARELVKTEPPFTAFKRGWDEFRVRFGLKSDPDNQEAGALTTAKAIGGGTAILMLAAAAGMTLDGIAHRVVDYSPEDGLSFNERLKFDMPDDTIKQKAFQNVAGEWTNAWDCVKHAHAAAKQSTEDPTTHHAKELYQDAYLRVLASDKQDVKSSLARDELMLKLFRVLLVLTLLLSLFAFGTLWRSHLIQRLAMALALAFTCFVLLYLWSTQSRHYYKRVFHAYAMIDGKTPPSGFLPLPFELKPVGCNETVAASDKTTKP